VALGSIPQRLNRLAIMILTGIFALTAFMGSTVF